MQDDDKEGTDKREAPPEPARQSEAAETLKKGLAKKGSTTTQSDAERLSQSIRESGTVIQDHAGTVKLELDTDHRSLFLGESEKAGDGGTADRPKQRRDAGETKRQEE